MCGEEQMKIRQSLLGCILVAACHRPSEIRGIYVNQDGSGTLFPCNDSKHAVLVPDSTLAARYRVMLTAPNQPAYVDLRGISTRSGSIYSGRRYFLVQQVIAIRPRAEGECPQVAHSISSVLRDSVAR
jgi:hypothetical protein